MYTAITPGGQPAAPTAHSGMRVLVVGAGWLGEVVARQLATNGATVFTLQRTPRAPAAGTTPVVGDIATAANDPVVRRALPTTVDALVLCLAPSAARGDDHGCYPRGAAGAAALGAGLGAGTLVYTSSTGVYGRGDGGVVRETDPLPATDGRVGLLRQAEAILAEGAGVGVPRVHLLRVAGLYGPGRDPARRWAQGDPDDPRWINMAWRDDVVAAVRRLLTAPVPTGAHWWNCSDGVPVQAGAVARALRDEGATVTVPGAPPAAPSGDGRGNQRVSAAALRGTGWAPSMPTVYHGLRALGHAVALPEEPLPRP